LKFEPPLNLKAKLAAGVNETMAKNPKHPESADLPDSQMLALPDDLATALRDAAKSDQADLATRHLSPEADRKIAAAATEYFTSVDFASQHSRRRAAWLKWAAAGVAASLALGVRLLALDPFGTPQESEPRLANQSLTVEQGERSASSQRSENTNPVGEPALANANDINRDGMVDIIDVYILAAAVQINDTSKMPDLTGDGQITQEDADKLVQRVVALPEQGGERGAGG
jgi:hypothetical protein